jgi:choline dehydrogenase-like flavoprotein
LLAESGKNVLLIEEGSSFNEDNITAFSLEEIQEKYRNHGYTLFFGKPKISYVEGCCIGGGSEINSGLYHRTPKNILSSWSKDFGIEGLSSQDMENHFVSNEKDLNISLLNQNSPLPSKKTRKKVLVN